MRRWTHFTNKDESRGNAQMCKNVLRLENKSKWRETRQWERRENLVRAFTYKIERMNIDGYR